jgi:hypothetical protein
VYTRRIVGCVSILTLAACSSAEGTPATVALGQACTSDSNCSTSLCIREAQSGTNVVWAGGFCSQACGTSTACPTGSACVTFGDGTAYCSTQCAATRDCRTGYVCSTAVTACLPDCRLGFSCGSSLTCDQSTGNCVAAAGNRAVGETCTLNAECKSSLCTPEQSASAGKQWTAGYCTQQCSPTTACPAAATCITYADGSSYCAASCVASSDCRSGYVCSTTAKVCLPDCRQGWSCGTSLSCDSGSGNCVGKMLPVGDPCTLNVDCASGVCTPEQSTSSGKQWSGGYCTQQCNTTTACPSSTTCIGYADGSSYCADTCASNSDCRAGYVCSTTAKACLPDCRQGWSCGTSLSCDSGSGNCVGKMLPVGDTCTLNVDCASGLCTPEQSTSSGKQWSGGYCTQQCSTTTACPASATCITYADASSYCVHACATNSDCRGDYVCATTVGACLPDCRQGWSCGSSLTCNTSTGTCG